MFGGREHEVKLNIFLSQALTFTALVLSHLGTKPCIALLGLTWRGLMFRLVLLGEVCWFVEY